MTETGKCASATHYGGPLVRLKHRSEFLAVRGGRRWSGPAFLIEAKANRHAVTEAGHVPHARFGFTITKKLGGAVARNRIRRRLAHALRQARLNVAPQPLDHVIVARAPALDRPYSELVNDFQRALAALAKPEPPPVSSQDRRHRTRTPT
ncbi:MAG TPA: ribonuclease P protein component [Hyphomicrobiaceae bacterium]|nr:ribonuclease P protein component [Hyphomicrobiaceae bacterium]